MSLLIVGSCSRLTQTIIKHLIQKGQYSKITLADLFPQYHHFHRYYKLREELEGIQTAKKTEIEPVKLVEQNDLYHNTKKADHILYVTHDYYVNTISKNKLMEATAEASQFKQNVLFVTPVEYDHQGTDKSAEKYEQSLANVRKFCPQATILRTDVMKDAELYSFVGGARKFYEDWAFSDALKDPRFKPRLLSMNDVAQATCNLLVSGAKGKLYYMRGGEESNPASWKTTEQSSDRCWDQTNNYGNFMKKYKNIQFEKAGEELKAVLESKA